MYITSEYNCHIARFDLYQDRRDGISKQTSSDPYGRMSAIKELTAKKDVYILSTKKEKKAKQKDQIDSWH